MRIPHVTCPEQKVVAVSAQSPASPDPGRVPGARGNEETVLPGSGHRPGHRRQPADAAPLLRHERRSLALGTAIAARITEDPDQALRMARARLAQFKAREADDWGHNPWLGSWGILLDGPLDEILAALTSTTQEGRDLRKSAPFAGVLSPDERAAVLDGLLPRREARRQRRSDGGGRAGHRGR